MAEIVEFLDTTLRDGNKLPHVVLDRHDRLVIARQLAVLGVDIIDAGYPTASEEERDIVAAIAEEVRGPRISALSRAVEEDVARVCRLLAGSQKPYVHIFLPLSPHFLKNQLKLSSKEILVRIQRCLEASEKLPVQFSFGEIAEADPEFLLEAAAVVEAGGAEVLNLADTNGGMHPEEVSELIGRVAGALDPKRNVRIGVHFHNDLGLATANCLAGLEAGARHVECTLGGLGERGGNAALEEVVFALEAFERRYNLTHNIRLDQLWRTSTLLSRLTGVFPHPNKAVLGKCALPESGRAEEGRSMPANLRKLMRAATIGRSEDALFGDQEMSRAGFQQQLQKFRIDIAQVDLDKAYGLYQSQVRRKKTVALSEVHSIVEQARAKGVQPAYSLVSFSVMTGSHCLPVGSVELEGKESPMVQSATGTGPVDALCRAVDRAVGLNPRLILYSVDQLTEGKDARAEITVSLAYMGRRFHGHSGSTDVVEASLRAYLEAVNNIEAYRRAYPEEQFYINGEELWWE